MKTEGADEKQKIYVFIDEIQYMENPYSFLKLIADHHKNIKIIVSGSSTLDIKKKFRDSLVGRKIVFEINTLRFSEYLLFKKKKVLLNITQSYALRNLLDGKKWEMDEILEKHQKELEQEFREYITYGGYPGIVKEEDFSKKTESIYEIYSTYVRKDIN